MFRKKSKGKALVIGGIILAVFLAVSLFVLFSFSGTKVSREMEISEAQSIVDKTFSELPKSTSFAAVAILENSSVTVQPILVFQAK